MGTAADRVRELARSCRSRRSGPLASAGSTTQIRARWLSPITNESRPNEVDKHFAGKPLATIPASAIGYPDGTKSRGWRMLTRVG
jgi:hypothetical protein